MRVLFYEDPLTDQNAFMWRVAHIEKDAPCLIELIRSGADARMLVSGHFSHLACEHGIEEPSLITVEEDTLLSCLPTPQLNVNTLFQDHYGYLMGYSGPEGDTGDAARAKSLADAFAAVLSPRLDGFEPDIIVTWAPAPHLRLLFPKALILHKEASLFTRSPYLLTYYLDPLGFHKWSYAAQTQRIKSQPGDALAALHRVRGALKEAFETLDSTADLIAETAPFRERTLLANHTNGVFFHDSACTYRSQAHTVLDVLEKTPSDTAVIVTEHPDCRALTLPEIAHIKSRYPNAFIWPELRNRPGSGQQLVRHADRVATVCSSVGLQALLWQKPLLGLGDNHLGRLAVDIEQSEHKCDRCDDIATWLTFNYSYPDILLGQKAWLFDHLTARLEQWRTASADDYFAEPIAVRSRMAAMHIDHARTSTLKSFGRRLGTSRLFDRVDFSQNSLFPSGWADAQPSTFGPYRWTAGTRATVRIPIAKGPDRQVRVQLGTHEGCKNQIARIGIGDRTLATLPLPLESGAQTLTFSVPDELIGEIFTTLWIEASEICPPHAGAAALGLISSKIEVSTATQAQTPHWISRDFLHSIIIPTLNGRETLEVVLPDLLASIPADTEVVISDNHSSDGTLQYLKQFDDRRLQVVTPPSQFDYGRNTDFAYSKATGVWLSHMGDDDQILRSRFPVLENVIETSGADMIFASRLRYHWPNYPEATLANTIDPTEFDDTIFLLSGPEAARRLVNSSNIRHTGSVVLHRDLVRKVRDVNRGVFMPQRLGEYFAYRVAAGLSTRVAFVNRPIVVIGRHSKSIGTSLHVGAAQGRAYGTDVEREIGSVHAGTGFNVQGQQPFSLEAALQAADVLKPTLGPLPLDFRRYYKLIEQELQARVSRGQLSQMEMEQALESGERVLGPRMRLQTQAPLAFGCPQSAVPDWGWPDRVDGNSVGVANINGVAAWFDAIYATHQATASLHSERPDSVPTRWLDS